MCRPYYYSYVIDGAFLHRINFEALTWNGGYVRINNYDLGSTPSVDARKYYVSATKIHRSTLTIDLIDPYHCSEIRTCSENMLDRGPPITKSTSLRVEWAGWSDDLAGVRLYELVIYKLQPMGDRLDHKGLTALLRRTIDVSVNRIDTTLVDPGVYALLLTAEDRAGNIQTARRYLIFDNVNVVTINRDSDKQLFVDSAAKNTTYTWVSVLWRGHFANIYQHTNKFLIGIAVKTPPIEAGYDEPTGQPPATVSMEPIPNVNAIVKYELVHSLDHQGGRTITTAPSSWKLVPNFKNETIKLDIPRVDADSIRIWIRAYDAMNNTKVDTVLVHVDCTPPIVQDVWFTRFGRTHLAVRHTTELFGIR
ncbi:hypothetical protein LSAT2_002263 [Lamellibrachia satsuma]|nr:hypothetical protein LSAT2_002263 [Lamellibrachia satsuma]